MIYIRNTSDIITREKAAEYLRDHVIIKRSDLDKIAALAKQHGIYEELKALDIDMGELSEECEE